ncbi:OmpA family protein [Flexithrix dorotheae]|uniref:OmpA family protein n=1 Tax=Flexithrix dorotheae TaxID=70993 RepID=UPI00037C0F53|nr:OmpA family protein [Flexithrix dorotheae]
MNPTKPNKFLFLLICVLITFTSFGQIVNNFRKKADKLYEQNNFYAAKEWYLQALEKDKENNTIKLRIAECYRQLSIPEEAEFWYRHFSDNEGFLNSQDPEVKYHFGLVLESNGKYAEAAEWFELYHYQRPNDQRVTKKLEGIKNIAKHYQDSSKYEVEELKINSGKKDFAPQFYKDGIVFTSERKPPYLEDGIYNPDSLYFKELYFSRLNPDGSMSDPEIFYGNDLNTNYHKGGLTFYDNGKSLIFTRALKSGISAHTFGLYFTQKAVNGGDQWIRVKGFDYNSRDGSYHVMHPTISEDGQTLYFVSNMPGGFGETDIYQCKWDESNNKWSEPENLGARINSPESELYPYISSDNILFFTSNGHGGLGGQDIFEYNLNNEDAVVENLGFPINTNKNDFALSFDRRGYTGYFSSNRDSEGESDIFRVTKNIFIKGVVKTENDSTVADASVILANTRTNEITGAVTDNHGRFRVKLEIDAAYNLSAVKKNFRIGDSDRVTTFGDFEKVMSKDFEIRLQGDDLVAKGFIRGIADLPVDGAKVILVNNRTKLTRSLETGMDGSYMFLLQPNEWYTIWVEKVGYFNKQVEINAIVKTTGIFRNDFDLERVVLNQYITMKNTTYPPNKGDLALENGEELENIARFLVNNPDYTIEMRIHTDAQGKASANQELSENRASFMKYELIRLGVASHRVEVNGFGEKELINKCKDDVDCTEEEHKQNRRVEFIIRQSLVQPGLLNDDTGRGY